MHYLTENQISSIRENPRQYNWCIMSLSYKLSENFMREFSDYIKWAYICIYQKLSEDFIRDYHTKVLWYFIGSNQNLSEEFILEFKEYIFLDSLELNKKIDIKYPSYKFMYHFRPFYNDKYIYLNAIRKIQKSVVTYLYSPRGPIGKKIIGKYHANDLFNNFNNNNIHNDT